MQKVRHIAVLAGTLCRRSCHRNVVRALGELAPPLLRLEVVEISRLSPYTKELDVTPPAEWRAFRRQILAADGLLFLAPENARAVPVALKNALNIAAHPEDRNAWEGKPGAIVNIPANVPARVFPRFLAPGDRTRRLRQALALLNVPVMQPLAAFPGDTDTLFDAAGKPANAATRRLLASFMDTFEQWVHTYRH